MAGNKELGHELWFHGQIAREQAEALLAATARRIGRRGPKDAVFLVRESASVVGQYCLSMYCRPQYFHCLFLKTQDGHYYVTQPASSFRTIPQLVQFFKGQELNAHGPNTKDSCCVMLTYPCNRDDDNPHPTPTTQDPLRIANSATNLGYRVSAPALQATVSTGARMSTGSVQSNSVPGLARDNVKQRSFRATSLTVPNSQYLTLIDGIDGNFPEDDKFVQYLLDGLKTGALNMSTAKALLAIRTVQGTPELEHQEKKGGGVFSWRKSFRGSRGSRGSWGSSFKSQEESAGEEGAGAEDGQESIGKMLGNSREGGALRKLLSNKLVAASEESSTPGNGDKSPNLDRATPPKSPVKSAPAMVKGGEETKEHEAGKMGKKFSLFGHKEKSSGQPGYGSLTEKDAEPKKKFSFFKRGTVNSKPVPVVCQAAE